MSADEKECVCSFMRRIPDIELQGKPKGTPISNHSPACSDYEEILFKNVIHDGTGCVMTELEAKEMIKESNEVYITQDVYMTQDQFDNLHEFTGY